jgi:hypothetical protein
MNLSAHFHLYHVVGFLSNSLGMSGYESTGLTCFCHQMGLSCLRNSGLFGYQLRFVGGLSTLCPLTESPSLVLVVGGQRVDNPVLIIA